MAHNHGAKTLAKAATATVASQSVGVRLLHAAGRHPLLIFGAGLLIGAYWCKTRVQTKQEAECCDAE